VRLCLDFFLDYFRAIITAAQTTDPGSDGLNDSDWAMDCSSVAGHSDLLDDELNSPLEDFIDGNIGHFELLRQENQRHQSQIIKRVALSVPELSTLDEFYKNIAPLRGLGPFATSHQIRAFQINELYEKNILSKLSELTELAEELEGLEELTILYDIFIVLIFGIEIGPLYGLLTSENQFEAVLRIFSYEKSDSGMKKTTDYLKMYRESLRWHDIFQWDTLKSDDVEINAKEVFVFKTETRAIFNATWLKDVVLASLIFDGMFDRNLRQVIEDYSASVLKFLEKESYHESKINALLEHITEQFCIEEASLVSATTILGFLRELLNMMKSTSSSYVISSTAEVSTNHEAKEQPDPEKVLLQKTRKIPSIFPLPKILHFLHVLLSQYALIEEAGSQPSILEKELAKSVLADAFELLESLLHTYAIDIRSYILDIPKLGQDIFLLMPLVRLFLSSHNVSDQSCAYHLLQAFLTSFPTHLKNENFLNTLYPRPIQLLLSKSLNGINFSSIMTSDRVTRERILGTLRLLCLCIGQHAYRIKYILLDASTLMDSLLGILKSGDKILQIHTVKLVKNMLQPKDPFYVRFLIKHAAFMKSFLGLLTDSKDYNNMLSSSLLHLFTLLVSQEHVELAKLFIPDDSYLQVVIDHQSPQYAISMQLQILQAYFPSVYGPLLDLRFKQQQLPAETRPPPPDSKFMAANEDEDVMMTDVILEEDENDLNSYATHEPDLSFLLPLMAKNSSNGSSSVEDDDEESLPLFTLPTGVDAKFKRKPSAGSTVLKTKLSLSLSLAPGSSHIADSFPSDSMSQRADDETASEPMAEKKATETHQIANKNMLDSLPL
jgi:hypothetical protein